MRIRFVIPVLAILALVSVVSAQTQTPTDVPKELQPLQGKWTLTSFNGEAIPPEAGDMSLVITGNRYQQIESGNISEEGTFTVDASKTPMWITPSIRTGGDAGAIQPGLIIVNGDTFQLGLAMAGNPTRPANMDAADLYVTARRVK